MSEELQDRWAVRFGYLGAGFYGWARQPGRRTIEGTILEGLRRFHLTAEGAPVQVAVASRTDRGVSARANALVLRSSLAGPLLLRALNGISPEIYFTAAASVSAGFRVRNATRRTYRYFEAVVDADFDRWTTAAGLFRGPVDVRSFGRAIPAHSPSWREVEAVRVHRRTGGLLIEVRAPSFVWGMVRKIVGALREVGSGRLPLSRLEDAIHGGTRLSLPMAEPEGLVLWDVEYPHAWTLAWKGPNRHQQAFLDSTRAHQSRRQATLDAVAAFGL